MAETPTKTAKLTIDDQSFDLPIYSPTAGPDVLDIRTTVLLSTASITNSSSSC